jgi:hypothetical protein
MRLKYFLTLLFALSTSVHASTIEVNGDVWLQPGEFSGVSYAEISAVCDELTGLCNGSLGGYSLSGWEWASPDDLNELFNYYISGVTGSSPLGPGQDFYFGSFPDAGSIADAFYADFVPTSTTTLPSKETWGFMAGVSDVAGSFNWADDIGANIVIADTGVWGFAGPSSYTGGWFKQVDIPLPGTISLLALALVFLGRRHS